jgi:hypothetical protein
MSMTLLKRTNLDHLELSSEHNFQFQIVRIFVLTTFIGRRKIISLGRWSKEGE